MTALNNKLADAIRKLLPWANEYLLQLEDSLSQDDDPHNRSLMERCSMEIEEAEAILAELGGKP